MGVRSRSETSAYHDAASALMVLFRKQAASHVWTDWDYSKRYINPQDYEFKIEKSVAFSHFTSTTFLPEGRERSSNSSNESLSLSLSLKKFAINETRGERLDLDVVTVAAQREKEELTVNFYMLCHAEAAKPVFPYTSFKLQRAARFTQREPLCPRPEPGVLLATVTTTRRAETSSGMSVSLGGNLGEASTLSQAATFLASFCVKEEECGEGSPRPGLVLVLS